MILSLFYMLKFPWLFVALLLIWFSSSNHNERHTQIRINKKETAENYFWNFGHKLNDNLMAKFSEGM